MALHLPRCLAHTFVWSRALAFGGGNEEVVALHCDSAGIPIGGDKAESGQGCRFVRRTVRIQVRCVEYSDRVGRSIGHEDVLAVGRLSQGAGVSSSELLIANRGVQECERLAAFG